MDPRDRSPVPNDEFQPQQRRVGRQLPADDRSEERGEPLDGLAAQPDESAVETPPAGITPSPGAWLAVRATQRESSPAWLTASTIDEVLAGYDSMLLTWADLASRISVTEPSAPV